MWYLFLFLLFLTYTSIWAHKYLCFRAKIVARTKAKLSSLTSLLSSTSAKLLTSLALRSLLYLLLAPGHLSNQHRFLNRLGLRHRVNDTARKSLISTGREPPVCTGFPTGTAPPVSSARALSTGQLARY